MASFNVSQDLLLEVAHGLEKHLWMFRARSSGNFPRSSRRLTDLPFARTFLRPLLNAAFQIPDAPPCQQRLRNPEKQRHEKTCPEGARYHEGQ